MRTTSTKTVWAGRVLSLLPCLLFLISAFFKLKGGPDLMKGFSHLGIPASMILPLAILEISCVAIYLIPRTSVIGAILLTGFIGGAICTHWRVGDPFYVHIILGIMVWLGLWLREPRLREILPLRTLEPTSPSP